MVHAHRVPFTTNSMKDEGRQNVVDRLLLRTSQNDSWLRKMLKHAVVRRLISYFMVLSQKVGMKRMVYADRGFKISVSEGNREEIKLFKIKNSFRM